MRKIIFFLIALVCLNTFGQNEAANWYFGYYGGLKFDLSNNTVSSLTNGKLSTTEGCASISDDFGSLLFYTDGITVWNKNHDVMSNGRGLYGDPSSTQSAIIVPKPNDDDIYFIFTVDDHGFNQPHYGLNYSVVDITLDGGLGEITSKNTNLLAECSEKITAVLKDCITGSIWVLALASPSGDIDTYDTFHAFEVGDLGVNPFSIKSTFNIEIIDERGYLKLSPDGNKMACANANNGLFLYDFDTSTGMVSNQVTLRIDGPNGKAYGIEFSPNNEVLYVSSSNDFFDFENPINSENPNNHSSLLVQFNLAAPNIQASITTIDDRQLYRGALQLGPNGKIYRALSSTYTQGINALGVINNPNEIGLNCNYQHNGISLGESTSAQGLPPFISSFFNTKIDIIKNGKSTSSLGLCNGDSYFLSADEISGASYIWTKDKITLSETSSKLEITNSGYYEVYIDPNNGDCALEGEAFVTFNQNPKAYNTTILQCDEDENPDGRTFFNLNEASRSLTDDVSTSSFKFYSDVERTSEVNSNSYKNILNPQTIYVEVINNESGCTSYSELLLSVSLTDSNDTKLVLCDDDGIEDGFHIFNLNETGKNITNGLPLELTITFFETYNDALLEENTLENNYTNTTAYSQIIYARVENNNNCYGVSLVELIVNPLPKINTEQTLYYCLNKFPETIKLNAITTNEENSSYNYSWSTGESTQEIQVNSTGVYTVSVTNSYGCSKTKTISVEPSNLASFESIKIKDASKNNTITVMTSGEGIYQYRLQDHRNIVVAPFQDSNIFSNIYPGIYNVSVRDTKNDCGIVNEKVSVIGFPKFFTPNNDGYHDTWQVYGVSEMFQPNTKIQIFNRYGKLIKELVPLGEGWNGLLNGTKLPSDDYWFYITLQDGRVFKNHFALIN